MNETDRAIVIASDGLWDRLSNQEIKEIVMSHEFYDKRDAEGAINKLIDESVRRWQRDQGMVDDITIVLAYISTAQAKK